MGNLSFIRSVSRGQAWPYLSIFGLTAIMVGFIQWTDGFADPDSFYHMKMTLLMLQSGGPVTEFPWLPLTVLAQNYADHHFLYHLLLTPFFLATGPVIGLKIATSLLAGATMAAFYGLLRTFGFRRYPIIFALLLATSSGFLFRLSLAKTPAIALLWFFLELIAIRQKRPLMLFLLAFTHVWLHGSWPLLPLMLFLSMASDWMVHGLSRTSPQWLASLRNAAKENSRLLWMAGSGLLLGLLINPFFPNLLRFYWEQIVQIAVINYRTVLPVGTEWWPFGPLDILEQAPLPIAAAVVSAAALGLLLDRHHHLKSIDREKATALLFTGLLCLLFLGLTLRQRRHLEYLAPCLTMLAAGLTSLLLTLQPLKKLLARLREQAGQRLGSPRLLLALALTMWLATGSWAIVEAHDHNRGHRQDRYQATADWLQRNLPPDALVINARWDDFPALFYQNSQQRWFSGLDPTFSHRADANRWQQVQQIWENDPQARPAATLRTLGSRYLLLRRQDGLHPRLSHDKELELAYHDNETILFVVKQP